MSAPFQIIGPSFFSTLRFRLHNRSEGARADTPPRVEEKNKLTAGRSVFMNKSDRRCGRGWGRQ